MMVAYLVTLGFEWTPESVSLVKDFMQISMDVAIKKKHPVYAVFQKKMHQKDHKNVKRTGFFIYILITNKSKIQSS